MENNDSLTDRKINMLRLAHKAGKLKFGTDAFIKLSNLKKVDLVILAEDISENSEKKINNVAKKTHVKVLKFLDKKKYGIIFNRNDTGVISFQDRGFSEAFCRMFLID